jgi:hypothetical protein
MCRLNKASQTVYALDHTLPSCLFLLQPIVYIPLHKGYYFGCVLAKLGYLSERDFTRKFHDTPGHASKNHELLLKPMRDAGITLWRQLAEGVQYNARKENIDIATAAPSYTGT